MKKHNESGQAIMELLALLLSLVIVFIGVILIMGLSIANIDILLDAKFHAESSAQYADYGNEGNEISRWHYTEYEAIGKTIPFLPGDRPSSSTHAPINFNEEFNNPLTSNHGDKYKFNTFNVIHPGIANNFAVETPVLSYRAANLLRGKSYDYSDENIITIKDTQYFHRQQTYSAFERLIGTSLKDIDLENNHSNTVYFPAMKVLDR